MKTLALRDRDLATLRSTFHRFPCIREVRVFGSRATGHARRASDIDLAITAPTATPDEWLELTEALEEGPHHLRIRHRPHRPNPQPPPPRKDRA
jgi:predicted nucleotidyltransferase